MTITHIGAGARYSKAVVHGNIVYLAGQVAGQVAEKAAGQGATEQTEEILSTIDALLAEAGSDKTKLLSVTIWLADMASFGEMNAVWDKWVVPGHAPARATVEAKLASHRYKVEITAIAAL
jgi:enamine deaminase RidA (YjgF/YER057c/UK114 family)